MQRTIKSYVLRAGRMSHRQQEALTSLSHHYLLPMKEGMWDLDQLFGRTAPVIVEIGFGMGRSLSQMAQNQPDTNFLGVEVHQPGIGSLVADLHEYGIKNVRIAAVDAVDLLKNHILDASLSGIQIFFPDPWPKKKHHKRRLIQPAFIQAIVQKIIPGGFIHCATDWQDYADQMLSVLSEQSELTNQNANGGFSPRPDSRPLTKFEQRGQSLGHGVWDLIFIRQRMH